MALIVSLLAELANFKANARLTSSNSGHYYSFLRSVLIKALEKSIIHFQIGTSTGEKVPIYINSYIPEDTVLFSLIVIQQNPVFLDAPCLSHSTISTGHLLQSFYKD